MSVVRLLPIVINAPDFRPGRYASDLKSGIDDDAYVFFTALAAALCMVCPIPVVAVAVAAAAAL